jgi:hypothetical protein
MKKKLHGINGKKISETIIKSVFASVGMGAVILLVGRLIRSNSPVQTVLISITIGGIAYALFLVLLHFVIQLIKYVFSLIRARFAREKL